MNKSKNTSWYRKRHKVLCTIAKPILKLLVEIGDNFIVEEVKTNDGAALILSNHISGFDPIKLGLSISDKVCYYVATDDLFNKKFTGGLLKFSVNPIPKSKSVSDLKCVKTILRVLKEGHKVAIFPEGNRTYTGELCHIDDSIAKLVKVAKVPVYIFNMEGGYSVDPRWSNKKRRNPNYCRLKKLIDVEEIKKSTHKELYDTIVENLKCNPFDYPLKKNYNHLSEYLERAIYYCPNCDSFETIYSHKNEVHCFNCGYELRYNKDLTFSLIKGEKEVKNVVLWDKIQKEKMQNTDPFISDDVIFSDNQVTLYEIIKYKGKRALIKNGLVTINNKELRVSSKKKEIVIPLSDIYDSCVVMKHKASFYVSDYQYQLDGKARFCALKYVQLYHHIKNIKNGIKEDEFLGL